MPNTQSRKNTVLITGCALSFPRCDSPKRGICFAKIVECSCTPGGIGFALATEFQARGEYLLFPLLQEQYPETSKIYAGFHVIATVRNASLLEELRSKGMSAVELDVTDEASIAACRAKVEDIVDGKLDILVNNA